MHSSTNFAVLDAYLASGRTSKVFVFLAVVTPEGRDCVLKMYVRKFDETKNYMPISTDPFDKDAARNTKNEEKMYKLIDGMDITIITLGTPVRFQRARSVDLCFIRKWASCLQPSFVSMVVIPPYVGVQNRRTHHILQVQRN